MGLPWQQGPLGRNPNGEFLVPGMPDRVLYAERLRRRMPAELGGRTVVSSDDDDMLLLRSSTTRNYSDEGASGSNPRIIQSG